MTRRLFTILIAVTLMAGLAGTAMSQDVVFKFGGWFRFRGIVANNQDLLSEVGNAGLGRDFDKFYDSVFRPSFTATMEDKARVFFQLDIPQFNQIGGEDCHQFGTGLLCGTSGQDGRTNVNVVVYNLQVKVPYVPGNWFVRVGRDNVFLPRGLVGRLPNLREFGIQAWGTVAMFKPRVEIYKREEGRNPADTNFFAGGNALAIADDDDVYIGKLPFTPMKGVRIMPYLTVWTQGRARGGTGGITGASVEMFYPALEVSGRFRNFFGKLDFIYQTGSINWDPGSKNLVNPFVDQDVRAFVAWVQAGGTFGPVTVSLNYVYASGDGDQGDAKQKQFFGVGCAFSDSGGAIGDAGASGCDARSQGPTDLWFGDKYNDNFTAGSRNIGGNTGGGGGRYARGNGTSTFSIDSSYRVLKNVLIQGTIGFIWSAKSRPSYIPTYRAGDAAAAAASPAIFNSTKYVGTEIDLNVSWTIYKGVSLSAGFDYLFAGGYGELTTPVAASAQVAGSGAPCTGAIVGAGCRLVNDNDDAWQAIWRLQWFF